MRKSKIFTTLMMSSVLLLAGCGGDVVPSGIVITSAGNVTTLEEEATLQLTAVVHPDGAPQTVAWSTSNEARATVSTSGLVTGVEAGNVSITATSTVNAQVKQDFLLTITAKVIPPVIPAEITVTAADGATSVEVGANLALTAVVGPVGAPQGVDWSASNANATVGEDGTVRGVAVGEVVITATSKTATTVSGEITLTVEDPTPPDPTIDWDSEDFATHADFMDSANGDPLKVKGKVSHLPPVVVGEAGSTISYYIQNGSDGYYIYAQDAVLFPVTAGKVYEVGGFKKYYNGTQEIIDVEHFKEINDSISYTVSDISAMDVMDRDLMKPYHASWVKIDVGLIESKPSTWTSAFSVNVKVNEKTIAYRVDPVNMTADEFAAIALKFQNAPVGSAIAATGIMSAFGYGTPKNQLQIMRADDLTTATLSDEDQVKIASESLILQNSITLADTSITLPTSLAGYDGVTVSWVSENAAISSVGVVTRPTATVDVKLTATFALNGKEATRDYIVTVFGSDETNFTNAHVLDFEDALPAVSYGCSGSMPSYDDKNTNTVALGTPSATWFYGNALIGGDSNDKRNGTFAVRMQSNTNAASSGRLELRDDFEFDMLEFKAAVCGNNTLGMVLDISYSEDEGDTWTVLERSFVINVYSLETLRIHIPATGAARVAIAARAGTGQRVNIDDIRLIQLG